MLRSRLLAGTLPRHEYINHLTTQFTDLCNDNNTLELHLLNHEIIELALERDQLKSKIANPERPGRFIILELLNFVKKDDAANEESEQLKFLEKELEDKTDTLVDCIARRKLLRIRIDHKKEIDPNDNKKQVKERRVKNHSMAYRKWIDLEVEKALMDRTNYEKPSKLNNPETPPRDTAQLFKTITFYWTRNAVRLFLAKRSLLDLAARLELVYAVDSMFLEARKKVQPPQVRTTPTGYIARVISTTNNTLAPPPSQHNSLSKTNNSSFQKPMEVLRWSKHLCPTAEMLAERLKEKKTRQEAAEDKPTNVKTPHTEQLATPFKKLWSKSYIIYPAPTR